MEMLIGIKDWLVTNWKEISEMVAYLIAIATLIVKFTPTLKDDAYLKKAVKFIGKYIALNR